MNEVRILASLNDPNIISYKQAFYDTEEKCLCIVMEYAGGGDVLQKVKEYQKSQQYFPETVIWNYLKQMLRGLKALHKRGILHRDIKSANIFLSKDNKSVKLGDLNISKVVKDSLAKTQTGTPYYASPEIYNNQPYGFKSDI